MEVTFDQVRRHSGQAVQHQKRLYNQRAVRRLFAIGDWVMRYYHAAKKCKLDSVWVGPYLMVSIVGWAVGIQKHPDSPILLIHCQDVKKVPQPSGVKSWITTPQPVGAPLSPVLGASTVAHASQGSPSVDVLLPDEGVVLADVDVDVDIALVGLLIERRLMWEVGHAATRCPNLDESFPFMQPGWRVEKTPGGFIMIPPWVTQDRRRTENGE